MNEAINSFLKANPTDSYMMTLAGQQVLICEGLAVMFFIIATIYNLFTNTIKSFGLRPMDISEFGRTVAVMFALGLYIPLTLFAIGIVSTVQDMTSIDASEQVLFEKNMSEQGFNHGMSGQIDRQYNFNPDEPGETKEKDDVEPETLSVWDFIGESITPSGIGALILDTITVALAGIVRVLIQVLMTLCANVLFVLGPYAFAASILPIWRDKISIWFNTFITIHFSFVVFNLLDQILYHNLFKDFFGDPLTVREDSGTVVYSLALNIAVIIAYLLPMWFAGKVVGSSDAGRFLSTFMQSATTIATAKIGGIGGFGNVAGGGSAASNVASVSKDAMSV
jgi:hypothetical protein